MMVPIYVTRSYQNNYRTHSGVISLPSLIALLTVYLIVFNIIGWGVFGLYSLADKVI